MPAKIMVNYWLIIAHLLPRKDHSCAPFPLLLARSIAMWQRYARIHHPLFVRLQVSTFRQCVAKAPQKQQPKEKPMKQRYFPFLIGAGLLVSGSIITGLANADMGDASHKCGKFMAKKLYINNGGLIILEELTSRQDKRFKTLDLNADGMIDKTELNGRIAAMFEKMDSNGDGSLDDKEIRTMKLYNYGKM
ncbi:EF-hand domain-containing protein [Alphaproteobacteria bacterium]|nr:EF-hand domain-containing protein [Alphaproteobacteria bacterium]